MLFTGGGTGGHVFPALAVLDELVRRMPEVRTAWVGDSGGMERAIVAGRGIPFYGVPTGKLRRYLSLRNLRDVFRVLAGIVRSIGLMRELRPAVLFSKGGFVSVPPVIAARLTGVPVLTHESDADPGLATRINARFSDRILVAYERTAEHFAGAARERVAVVGNPVRRDVLAGDRDRGLAWLGFDPSDERPVLLVLGGSLGARQLNELVAGLDPELRRQWRIVHQTGDNGVPLTRSDDYVATPFLHAELPHVMAAADVVLCRAGASTLWEAAALARPMLLVPLVAGSRGDQVRNAAIFERAGAAQVFSSAAAIEANVGEALRRLGADPGLRRRMGEAARTLVRLDAGELIADLIGRAVAVRASGSM